MRRNIILSILILQLMGCQSETKTESAKAAPFMWENANVYFLLVDRFNNGNPENDINFGRTAEAAKLRGFEGGDIKGVIDKVEDGYFSDLGVTAIWMTPIVEQIHGATDEGTGLTYGFHGYWIKDWTQIDPNFGTAEELKQLIEAAHARGIRVLLDAVINHTGPVTEKDPVWPESWVRTGPRCEYTDYESTISCTLVDNLPDIRTEDNEAVELPPQLIEKWKAEGRYEQEMEELDAFFERTGHPRAPRFYIMKWLTDYIREFGFDGYRVDTVKHTEEYVWQEFRAECDQAFKDWKEAQPEKVLDANEFYLVGEVYNYNISGGRYFDFGDRKVDYFDGAFNSLINFEFKYNARQRSMDAMFQRYASILSDQLKGYSVLNYLSSHDDGSPYDPERKDGFDAAVKLLLSPGAAQIYYGDEIDRPLIIPDADGDATLRSVMDWDDVSKNQDLLRHWQRLGQFRKDHPAVGAGSHQKLTAKPYTFKRSYSKNGYTDAVVVGLNLKAGEKDIRVNGVFADGTEVRDAYSDTTTTVVDGMVRINTPYPLVLLEQL